MPLTLASSHMFSARGQGSVAINRTPPGCRCIRMPERAWTATIAFVQRQTVSIVVARSILVIALLIGASKHQTADELTGPVVLSGQHVVIARLSNVASWHLCVVANAIAIFVYSAIIPRTPMASTWLPSRHITFWDVVRPFEKAPDRCASHGHRYLRGRPRRRRSHRRRRRKRNRPHKRQWHPETQLPSSAVAERRSCRRKDWCNSTSATPEHHNRHQCIVDRRIITVVTCRTGENAGAVWNVCIGVIIAGEFVGASKLARLEVADRH